MKRPSSSAVVATGALHDGVIRLDDKVTAAAELKTVRNGGVVLTVEPASEDAVRLVKMRKYYRAVVLKRIAAAEPLNADDMHGVLCAKFLGHPVTVVNRFNGEEVTTIVYPSTSTLDAEAFWAFVEQCRALGRNTYNLDIPDPDPAWRLHAGDVAA